MMLQSNDCYKSKVQLLSLMSSLLATQSLHAGLYLGCGLEYCSLNYRCSHWWSKVALVIATETPCNMSVLNLHSDKGWWVNETLLCFHWMHIKAAVTCLNHFRVSGKPTNLKTWHYSQIKHERVLRCGQLKIKLWHPEDKDHKTQSRSTALKQLFWCQDVRRTKCWATQQHKLWHVLDTIHFYN